MPDDDPDQADQNGPGPGDRLGGYVALGSHVPLGGHVTMLTLGVVDLERATHFYQEIGFQCSPASQPGISFMLSSTIVVGLFPINELSKDANVDVGMPGCGAIAMAQNRSSEEDVDRVMAQAEAAGARIVKPAQKVFWGGYSGYFADPDGHLWEVAYNPFAELDSSGRMHLPTPEPKQSDS